MNESLEQLDILSFDQNVFLAKAKIMYKIYNNLAPCYLHEMFQMRNVNLDSTMSNLRSVANKHYVLPQAKCNLFKGSLSFSGVLIWNSLPLDMKNSSSLNVFSKRCAEWIKYYFESLTSTAITHFYAYIHLHVCFCKVIVHEFCM